MTSPSKRPSSSLQLASSTSTPSAASPPISTSTSASASDATAHLSPSAGSNELLELQHIQLAMQQAHAHATAAVAAALAAASMPQPQPENWDAEVAELEDEIGNEEEEEEEEQEQEEEEEEKEAEEVEKEEEEEEEEQQNDEKHPSPHLQSERNASQRGAEVKAMSGEFQVNPLFDSQPPDEHPAAIEQHNQQEQFESLLSMDHSHMHNNMQLDQDTFLLLQQQQQQQQQQQDEEVEQQHMLADAHAQHAAWLAAAAALTSIDQYNTNEPIITSPLSTSSSPLAPLVSSPLSSSTTPRATGSSSSSSSFSSVSSFSLPATTTTLADGTIETEPPLTRTESSSGLKKRIVVGAKHAASSVSLSNTTNPPSTSTLQSKSTLKRTKKRNQSITTPRPAFDPLLDSSRPRSRLTLITRLSIILLFILLLWVTSLTLAQYIAARYIVSMDMEEVGRYWKYSWDLSVLQGEEYYKCNQQQIKECNRVYNVTVDKLIQEYERKSRYNTAETNRIVAQSSACENGASAMIITIQLWVTQGLPLIYRSDQCTTEEISYLQSLIGDGGQTTTTSTSMAQSQSFTQQQQALTSSYLSAASSSISAYNDYNYAYLSSKTASLHFSLSPIMFEDWGDWPFLSVGSVSFNPMKYWDDFYTGGIKEAMSSVVEIVSSFVSCAIGPPPYAVNRFCPMGSLREMMSSFADEVGVWVHKATYGISRLISEVNSFVSKVSQLMNTLKGTFDIVNLILVPLSLIGANPLSVLDGFVPSIPLSSFQAQIPVLSFIPLTIGDYHDYIIGKIFGAISSTFTTLEKKLATAYQQQSTYISNAIQTQTTALRKKLQVQERLIANLFPIFSDYNPPPIQTKFSQLLAALDANSEQYLQDQKNTLNQLRFTSSPSIYSRLPTINSSSLLSSLPPPNFSSATFKLNLAKFADDINFSEFMTAISSVVIFFYVMDYLYRGWQTLSIVLKYAVKPNEQLPLIDVRAKRNTDKLVPHASSMAAQLVLHPYILSLFFLFLFIFILFLLTSLYIPIYRSYERGCVTSTTGTLFTRNAYAIFYNLASTAGSTAWLIGIGEYDKKRTQTCATYADSSADEQNTHQQTIDTQSQPKQMAAYRDINLLTKCIAPQSFNIQRLPSIIAGASPSSLPANLVDPFLYVSPQLKANCSIVPLSSSVLVNAVFNCSYLPSCTNDLCGEGPAPAPLIAATFNSGCRTEFVIHSSILRCALILLIYICLNASRSLLMKAIVRFAWRPLTPDGFLFVGHVQHTGILKQDYTERIRRKIKRSIMRFECEGILFGMAAILAHAPYVVALIFLVDPFDWTNGGGSAKPPKQM